MTNALSTLPAKIATAAAKWQTTVTLYAAPTYSGATQSVVEDPSPATVTNASPPAVLSRPLLIDQGGIAVEAQASMVFVAVGATKIPERGGRVVVGGDTWRILSVTAHRVDETQIAAYEAFLSRAEP